MKIFPANIFQKMLWFEKYYQNCQASFGCSKCEWVKEFKQVWYTCLKQTYQNVLWEKHINISKERITLRNRIGSWTGKIRYQRYKTFHSILMTFLKYCIQLFCKITIRKSWPCHDLTWQVSLVIHHGSWVFGKSIVCLTRVWQSLLPLFCDKTFEFSIQTWQKC